MFRLAIPLLLVTLVSWALLYGVRGKIRTETHTAIRQGCVALSIAATVLLALGAAFSLGGLFNAN